MDALKQKTNEKESIFSPLVLALLVIVIAFLLYNLSLPKASNIQIHFFDVGQGDAALISTPSKQNILIDGGPNDQVSEKLDKTLPFYHRSLDAVVLTHPHADHLDGLLNVLDNYEIKKIYLTGVVHTTTEYLDFLEKIKTKKIETEAVKSGDLIDLGNDIKFTFLFPEKELTGQRIENLNNSSIVARLSWGEEKVLFTGDIEKEGQEDLLKINPEITADLVKIPHHGSKDANNENFLTKIHPKFAVISVGKDNKFNHPAPSTLDLLKSVTLFRTDYDGDITFEMNQNNIFPKK